MNRRQWMTLSGAALARGETAPAQQSQEAKQPDTPDKFLLKDYRPESIYRIPKTNVKKAKFPVIDVHCHGARPPQQVEDMVKLMDPAGVEKTVIFTGASTPERFSEVRQPYANFPNRFDLWCSFDLAGVNDPGFGPNALKSLEECHRLGVLGVGEVSDKGRGFASFGGAGRGGRGGRAGSSGEAARGGFQGRGSGFSPPSTGPGGPHPDDARMDALWDKCGQLGMPINIHVSDPIWSYQPMDRTNDGLMNGYTWMILAEALRNCALYADLVVKPSNSREPQPQHLAPAHSTKGAQVGDRVANAPDLLRGVNQRPCLLRCWWDNLAGLKRR